ncbi:CHRD domain-containing protein [Rubellicoccus peritrichatus]|uniref:CHRD domain-containing protein n=1 Tax=Rubellicoccus peritrichatus TaxID=3080537 RepID=A0AAQ3LCZ2_9BACT|nr:CHRD domain-containing protein [Puniceicoccus sp. CR14]WOO43724.1 CHRD domain-containing protein [Puniceicoccus sp. CR14]
MKFICCLTFFGASLLSTSAAVFSYQAILTPEAVVPGSPTDDPAGISTASGLAQLTLTTGGVGGPTLSYSLTLTGLDVSETIPRPTLTGPDDLVRAVHIHFGAVGVNDVHGLNVYGFPREDDADLVVNSSTSTVSGLWDDSDANFGSDGIRGAGDSVALSDALTALQAGELYFQVHTFGFRQGEIRGQITQVPEPAQLALVVGCIFFVVVVYARRSKHRF